MVGKVEYLSKQEASAITIQAPQDLECDAIDLSELSQNPMEVLDLQESRRRLREMAGGSCKEQVRLGNVNFVIEKTFKPSKDPVCTTSYPAHFLH